MRPGTLVTIRETPVPRSAPTDTGTWFVAGQTERGPVAPQLVSSMADYARIFGVRVSYGMLYDALEAFFREGGRRAYVARTVGPAATTGFLNLLDGAAAIALRADALGPGAYSSSIAVQVSAGVAGGTFVITVRDGGVIKETSPDLADTAAAVAWSEFSNYIRLSQGASVLDPAVLASTALSAGTDDRGSITDAHYEVSLNRFSKDLGPGQVSIPGRTTAQSYTDLLEHSNANLRIALLDAADTPTQATLLAAAAGQKGINGRFSGYFWPWVKLPGLTAGTTRVVPPSAFVAGRAAASDVSNTPNKAIAGKNGELTSAVGLSQLNPTDAEREILNNGGVNVIKPYAGGFRIYGFRSLADPVADPRWRSLGGSRLIMAFEARSQEILERYVFEEIDGFGRLFARLDGELTDLANEYYLAGSLYGITPDKAYNIDTGPSVNTPATIANEEIHALAALKISPMGEYVVLELVRVATQEEVA